MTGGNQGKTQTQTLKEGVDVVVGTPGRVGHLLDVGKLEVDDLEAVVMDECDVLLGDSFEFAEQVAPLRDATLAARKRAAEPSSCWSPRPSRRTSCGSSRRFSRATCVWCKARPAQAGGGSARAPGGLLRRGRGGRPERVLPQVSRARATAGGGAREGQGQKGQKGRGWRGAAHAALLQQDRDVSSRGEHVAPRGSRRRAVSADAVPRGVDGRAQESLAGRVSGAASYGGDAHDAGVHGPRLTRAGRCGREPRDPLRLPA